MAGKKTVFDKEKAFLSIIGAGAGEPQEQEKQPQEQEKQLKEEIKEEHLQSEQATTQEPKKRGRKKLENREKKKRYSFTILPSVYEKAQEKAEAEGKTLSELVSNFLVKYGK